MLAGAGRKTRVHQVRGCSPLFLCNEAEIVSELSIFIDESGDFGTYDIRSPYYIITMIFTINHVISVNPLLNCAVIFQIWELIRIILYTRARSYAGKKNMSLCRSMKDDVFWTVWLPSSGIVNGQTEVTRILVSVFNALLPRIEIKRVLPSDYRLFQAADMFCSMELITLKLENSSISASEIEFFGNLRDLKKNYLKPLAKFEWK